MRSFKGKEDDEMKGGMKPGTAAKKSGGNHQSLASSGKSQEKPASFGKGSWGKKKIGIRRRDPAEYGVNIASEKKQV